MPNPTYLTRQDMEAVIKEGGSVMWPPAHLGQTRIITTFNELPSELDIAHATGDEEAVKAAKKNLEKERERIDAEIAKASAPAVEAEPEPPEKPAKSGGK